MSFHTGDGVYVFVSHQIYECTNSVRINEFTSFQEKWSGSPQLGDCKRVMQARDL